MINSLIIILLLIFIIIVLLIRRKEKLEELEHEKFKLNNNIEELNYKKKLLEDTLDQKNEAILRADDIYKKTIEENLEKAKEQQENFVKQESELEKQLQLKKDYYEKMKAQFKLEYDESVSQLNLEKERLENLIHNKEKDYESLIGAFIVAEKEKQDKLFYTIKIEDEFKDDIDFLLNTVAPQVRHPDIISKLVWQEYVKPNLDDTLKRLGIENEPGIYKLTSLIDNKVYIGKSVNLKKRIQEHFKSVVGITSIADQAVHHQILKEGFWNWTIEKVCDCEKEELSEKEKFYINFFNSQNYGYNKNAGG